MLSVVLYDCETWSLTLREERRLRVFENKILRRIFEPKRDENGEWKRFHNEELLINYRNRFVTQYITYLNIREALSGTLSPLSTHDRLILV